MATVQENSLASCRFQQAFYRLGGAFLGARRQGRAHLLSGVLLTLCLAVGGLQVLVSYAGRDFVTALTRLLYERLHTLGLTYVSIGHRNTLKEFHDLLLTLGPNGRTELSRLPTAQGARQMESAAVSSWAEPALVGSTQAASSITG